MENVFSFEYNYLSLSREEDSKPISLQDGDVATFYPQEVGFCIGFSRGCIPLIFNTINLCGHTKMDDKRLIYGAKSGSLKEKFDIFEDIVELIGVVCRFSVVKAGECNGFQKYRFVKIISEN